MDQNKVKAIQQTLLENPELHVKLVEALNELGGKVKETITPEELISSLKPQTKNGGTGSTHEEFWAHYR